MCMGTGRILQKNVGKYGNLLDKHTIFIIRNPHIYAPDLCAPCVYGRAWYLRKIGTKFSENSVHNIMYVH